jgi:Glycosyltransferase family 87
VKQFDVSTLPDIPRKASDDKITPLKVGIAVLMLAVGVSILTYAMSANEAAHRDFVCYWAAGQQLAHHGNPYDGEAILHLEKSIGYKESYPFFMRNPPTAFFLALPLGFVGAKMGVVLWSLAIIACLMVSIRLLWILNGRPPDRLHLTGYLFPPTLACLLAGQTGIFLLFGIVLFLYFNESKPYLAGTALIVLTLKPHLFLPFGAVLLLWIITTMRYRIAAGALAAIATSIAIASELDHSAWSHYANMVRTEQIDNQFVPTISHLFRMLTAPKHPWVQFIPAAIACRWAVRYYLDHRGSWRWRTNSWLLLLVSVAAAPYAWFTDEVIVLPAILGGLYRSSNAGQSLIPYCCVAGIALFEVFAHASVNSRAFIWTAPAWLLWYVFAVRGNSMRDLSSTSRISS